MKSKATDSKEGTRKKNESYVKGLHIIRDFVTNFKVSIRIRGLGTKQKIPFLTSIHHHIQWRTQESGSF